MSKKYNEKYYARYGDPRTANWLLMDNQIYPFALSIWYLVGTIWVLPMLMRNRSPFVLRKMTVVYNLAMMFVNAWLFYEFCCLTVWKSDFNWFCQSIDWSNTEEAIKVAEIGWIFFLVTKMEQDAAVFVILRKRDSKLTFIHKFLRVQGLIVVWYGLKFAPGGYNSLYSLMTTFMYTLAHFHYALVIAIPSLLRPYWKRIYPLMLYAMQLTIFIYYSLLYFLPPKGCKLSFFILRLNMGSAILFFLFSNNFFRRKHKNNEITINSLEKSQKTE